MLTVYIKASLALNRSNGCEVSK